MDYAEFTTNFKNEISSRTGHIPSMVRAASLFVLGLILRLRGYYEIS